MADSWYSSGVANFVFSAFCLQLLLIFIEYSFVTDVFNLLLLFSSILSSGISISSFKFKEFFLQFHFR